MRMTKTGLIDKLDDLERRLDSYNLKIKSYEKYPDDPFYVSKLALLRERRDALLDQVETVKSVMNPKDFTDEAEKYRKKLREAEAKIAEMERGNLGPVVNDGGPTWEQVEPEPAPEPKVKAKAKAKSK